MSALSDLGPVLPPRIAVRSLARELRVLAARAEEFAGTGPTSDLGLAIRQIDRARALLGGDLFPHSTGEG